MGCCGTAPDLLFGQNIPGPTRKKVDYQTGFLLEIDVKLEPQEIGQYPRTHNHRNCQCPRPDRVKGRYIYQPQ